MGRKKRKERVIREGELEPSLAQIPLANFATKSGTISQQSPGHKS